MLTLPKGYLEDEEREGFLVDAEMKSNWAAQLEVLAAIDKICNKYGLKYFVAYGTLLGAARHNGYVPWDDDVDICMMREDYDTFISVAPNELPQDFDMLYLHSVDEWQNMILRVINATYITADDYFLVKFHGCPYAIGIDIFPFDYMPDDAEESRRKDEYLQMAFSMGMVYWENDEDIKVFGGKYDNGLSILEQEFNYRFYYEEDMSNQLLMLTDYIMGHYGSKGSRVTNYWNYLDHSTSFIYHRIWYSDVIELEFEMTTVKAPIGVEAVLNTSYGNNFMSPVRGGSAHDYPCYKGQREALIEKGLKDMVDAKRKSICENMCVGEPVKHDESKEPLPEECLQFLEGKKVILYVLNSANIMRYKEQVYDKIERAIQIFEESKDKIAVILSEDITFLATLNDMYPDVFEKYIALRQSVADKGIGIVSDNLYYDYVSVCDAYYGDGTTVIGDFRKAGKPIMLQNYAL